MDKTGTIETIAPLPMATPITAAPPVPNIKTQSLVALLPTIQKENGTQLINYDQSLSLTSLKFKRGDHILTLEDRPFVYEIVNMLNTLDYEIVYNFLNAGWENVFGQGAGLRKMILFENPLLKSAKDRLDMDMEIYRNNVGVVKGAMDCKKCGSEETLTVEKMTRSSDEPMTLFHNCLSCQYKWKE